jgi:hypothetical protein
LQSKLAGPWAYSIGIQRLSYRTVTVRFAIARGLASGLSREIGIPRQLFALTAAGFERPGGESENRKQRWKNNLL